MSKLLHKIERLIAPITVPNITLYLVIAQTFVLLAVIMQRLDPRMLMFAPSLFLDGDWWRIFTFVAIPPSYGMLVAFALYLFYLYGNALEQHLGVVRYNLFLFTGYFLTVGLAFISPNALATNLFLGGAVFLAFAFLNPDFTLHLFFILPVKIKWLALIVWVGYGYTFVTGGTTARLGVLAATGNFLLFFGGELIQRIRTGRRAVREQVKRTKLKEELSGPMHKCSVCGRDSDSNTELDFRYRTESDNEVCYCNEHLPPRG
jgi:hypothetical protein